jgi:hypothetical protein
LSWKAGERTSTHEVYFGTAEPLTLVSTQSDTVYNPGTLDYYTTYYWRIDQVNEYGTTQGDLWSFTTISPPVINHLSNPGFEENDDSWTGPSTSLRVSDGNSRTGNWSWRITNTSEAFKYGIQEVTSLLPNTVFTLSGYIRTQDITGSGNGARLQILFYNADTHVSTNQSSGIKGTNDYTKLSLTNTSPEIFTHAIVRLAITNCSGIAWFDDMSLDTDNYPKKSSLSQVSVMDPNTVESKFSIYPNPSSGEFIFDFELEDTEKIEITIYSLNGTKILSLCNREFIPGRYKERFNAESLSAGVYFVRISVGQKIETKRIILIK